MTPLNTRIAPSNTGDMHLGTARTAYFNWLAARASGGRFILRIDDTDPVRSKPEFVQPILDTMEWLGLDYDELFYQSHGLDYYTTLADNLVAQGQAVQIEGGAVSLKIPEQPPQLWHDDIAGDVAITPRDLDSMAAGIVLMRSDGSPTYHWASVLDDIACKINYVIRGTDHITNTAKQAMIYAALGEPLPRYAHVGLVYKDKKKLSKRDGASSMISYKDSGVDPDAMLNFMARIGWGPTVDDRSTAMLPRERMLELFLNGGKMRNSPANMDLQSLASYDRKYKSSKRSKVC